MCPWQKQEFKEIGKMFPTEYLELLSDQLQFTLYDWLKAQNAPPELVEALSCAAVLQRYGVYLKHGELSDASAEDIPALVAEVAAFIKKFGGRFSDASSSEIRFAPEVIWEGCRKCPE